MRCNNCNRPLTNPVSIQRGYGPICYRRLKLKNKNDEIDDWYKDMDQGPRENNNYPTLQYYLNTIEMENCRHCKEPIINGHVFHYIHHGGEYLRGFKEKQWIFVVCDKCHYEWALWKLQIKRKVITDYV